MSAEQVDRMATNVAAAVDIRVVVESFDRYEHSHRFMTRLAMRYQRVPSSPADGSGFRNLAGGRDHGARHVSTRWSRRMPSSRRISRAATTRPSKFHLRPLGAESRPRTGPWGRMNRSNSMNGLHLPCKVSRPAGRTFASTCRRAPATEARECQPHCAETRKRGELAGAHRRAMAHA